MLSSKSLRWVAGQKTPAKIYIPRVFNYGTFKEWKSLKNRYSQKQILEAAKNPLAGQWNQRAKTFAEAIFNIRMPSKVLISYDA